MDEYIVNEKGQILIMSHFNGDIITAPKIINFWQSVPYNYELAAVAYESIFGQSLGRGIYEKMKMNSDFLWVDPNREFFIRWEHDGETYVVYMDEIKTHKIEL